MRLSPLAKTILDMLTVAGPASADALAEGLSGSRYQVSGVCGQLKREGLIHRRPDLEDQSPAAPSNRHKHLAVWAIGPEPPIIKRRYRQPGRTGITAKPPSWLRLA